MMKKFANRTVYIVFAVLMVLACLPVSNLLEPTATPSEIPPLIDATASLEVLPVGTSETSPLPTATLVALPTPTAPRIPDALLPELYAFVQAPDGVLTQPYVILVAFQDIPDVSIEITGIVNSREFVCYGSPCAVPVPSSSQLVYQAVSSAGNSSEEVSATIRVIEDEGGYRVYLDAVSQYTIFSDACLRFWGVKDETNPTWAQFVQFPYQLNTNKTLHHLVTNLILHGVVDVGDCPAGGLSAGLDWPTGCGLERARPAMIEWQNQFDGYIWLASRDIGIPPKILKTLIEVESQFWPGNQRFYVDEVGLGQINQLGVDVLLRRDPQVYQEICAEVLGNCEIPYALLSEEDQALLRGALVNSQSAVCDDCPYGLNLENAKHSIKLVSQVLKANCETVKLVVDDYQDDALVDAWEDPYTDYWKFTLFAYHSGISCFENAVEEVANHDELINWENFTNRITVCESGTNYVDGLWGNLLAFDSYLYTVTNQDEVDFAPVFAPERTPFPTPILSTAQVSVRVFIDANQNGFAEDSEWMGTVPVTLRAANGMELSTVTVDGRATFDLSNFPANINAVVSLPGLYRSETFEIPVQGVVTLDFIFDQPTLPTAIP